MRRSRLLLSLLTILFIAFGCSKNTPNESELDIEREGEKTTIVDSLVNEMQAVTVDNGGTECVEVKLSDGKMTRFPFAISDSVVIHSFDPELEGGLSRIHDNQFLLSGIEQTKELSVTQIAKLYKVLYGSETNNKDAGNESMACYNPHHAIVFYQNKIPIEFLEICIECQGYETNGHLYVDFCDEKWCDIFSYFKSIGLSKTTEDLNRRCK